MSKSQDLFPNIPNEIRAARIGTCFNSITRKLIDRTIAIDPTRLKKGALMFVNGTGDLKLKANSSTNADVDDTFFGLDTNIKAGLFFGSASLGFNTSIASSSATNSQGLNCFCSYIYNGQKLQLLNFDSETLYNFMSEEFQKAYTAVITSNNANEYFANYMNFIQKFGYGCVTELYLTSGSSFQIEVKYSDKSNANKCKYGGSFGLSTPWGGGSVASEFAKEILNTNSTATMELKAKQLPENTPTKDWCNSMMQSVLQEGFSKLSQKPDLIRAYTGESPKAPELPEGIPSKKEEPKKNDIDISEDLQNKIMKDDNFTGTWEEYEKAQKEAYDKLKPTQIVQEAYTIQQQSKSTSTSIDDLLSQENTTFEETFDQKFNNPWDLGGYIPFNYKITAWNDLFPKLTSFSLPTTFTSIYISKIYIYYFTRLQFSSYLYFLADVGGKICENDAIETDAIIYSNICSSFLQEIQGVIKSNKKIDKNIYNRLVTNFEKNIMDQQNFFSKKVYSTFFSKYNFFIDCSYGFIVVDSKLKIYMTSPGNRHLPCPFSLLPMLKDAERNYPIIRQNGVLDTFVYFVSNKWTPSKWISNKVTYDSKKEKDKDGYYYYNLKFADNPTAHRLYEVGFKHIPIAAKNISIRGLQMFNDMPFNELKEFAKPRFESNVN